MQGSNLNETSSVTFVNVKVPIENLIGTENMGFKPLMYNVKPLTHNSYLTSLINYL